MSSSELATVLRVENFPSLLSNGPISGGEGVSNFDSILN
jgi:hypothetical protein